MKKNQKGFSLIEVLIVVVAIGIFAGLGWYIWQRKHSSKPNTTSSSTSPASTQSSPPLPVKTFSFSKDGAAFSYNYPAEFTETINDDTHTVTDLSKTGFAVSKRFIDANDDTQTVLFAFQPLNFDNDIANIRTLAKEGLAGNKSSLSRFTSSPTVTTLADCTTNNIIVSSSGQNLLQCKLNDAYGDTRTGAVIFAINEKGLCSLQYNLSKEYWDLHSKDWPTLFMSLKCS